MQVLIIFAIFCAANAFVTKTFNYECALILDTYICANSEIFLINGGSREMTRVDYLNSGKIISYQIAGYKINGIGFGLAAIDESAITYVEYNTAQLNISVIPISQIRVIATYKYVCVFSLVPDALNWFGYDCIGAGINVVFSMTDYFSYSIQGKYNGIEFQGLTKQNPSILTPSGVGIITARKIYFAYDLDSFSVISLD